MKLAIKHFITFLLCIVFLGYLGLIYVPVVISLVQNKSYESEQHYMENNGIVGMSEDELKDVQYMVILKDELMKSPALIIKRKYDSMPEYQKNISMSDFDDYFVSTLATYIDGGHSFSVQPAKSIEEARILLRVIDKPDFLLKDSRRSIDFSLIVLMSIILLILGSTALYRFYFIKSIVGKFWLVRLQKTPD